MHVEENILQSVLISNRPQGPREILYLLDEPRGIFSFICSLFSCNFLLATNWRTKNKTWGYENQ